MSLAPWFDLPRDSASPEELARERIADQLKPDEMAQRFRSANRAMGLEDADSDRRSLRLFSSLYLDRASIEPQREIDGLRAERPTPEGRLEADLALAPTSDERKKLFERWVAEEERERGVREDWTAARDAAARGAGASSLVAFLDAMQPRPATEVARSFERGAIEPLDDRIERAARLRWSRFQLDPGERGGYDEPAFRAIAPLVNRLSRDDTVEIVRWVGTAFGEETASNGPRLAVRISDRPWSRTGLTRDGEALVVPGIIAGPAGLWDLLGVFGTAVRAGRLAEMRGTAAVRFADRAFAYAAHTLWRRLVLCPRFRTEAGLRPDGAEIDEQAFHDAVAMRLAWAYLQTVTTGIGSEDPGFESIIRRASGGPSTPAHRRAVAGRDPAGSAELRGVVLGLLLEERLRSRFGRSWFSRPEARRWILEMWEAEPDLTAEEMAGSLDLGTIEPTPMVDACRQLGRE